MSLYATRQTPSTSQPTSARWYGAHEKGGRECKDSVVYATPICRRKLVAHAIATRCRQRNTTVVVAAPVARVARAYTRCRYAKSMRYRYSHYGCYRYAQDVVMLIVIVMARNTMPQQRARALMVCCRHHATMARIRHATMLRWRHTYQIIIILLLFIKIIIIMHIYVAS